MKISRPKEDTYHGWCCDWMIMLRSEMQKKKKRYEEERDPWKMEKQMRKWYFCWGGRRRDYKGWENVFEPLVHHHLPIFYFIFCYFYHL